MFQSARIKLTLWYLVIIMMVSVFFSVIVYLGFTKEIGRGFRMQSMHRVTGSGIVVRDRLGYQRILPFVIYPDDLPPEEFIEIINLAKRRFAFQLFLINGGILVLAGTAGYFLAGKTLQPIEVMVEEQKRFVSDASHELRTPLTSLRSEAEVALRDKKLTLTDAKILLKSNVEEVDKVQNLINYLLALGKYERGQTNLSKKKINLADVVRVVIKNHKTVLMEKDIKLILTLNDIYIKANLTSVEELVSILLDNAIKYSGKHKIINVSLRKNKRSAILEVKDEGVGIDKNDIPHIFDRFYRADSSRSKTEVEGYGLGLSIAKSIVDLHKGEIKVKSKLNKGSTFKVILPV